MSTIHPTKTVQSVQPKYTSRFSCIGPDCEDNCCTGWAVSIDKKTYNTYRQSQHPALAERFDTKVKRTRSLSSDKQYARIEMNPGTRACPFMEEKLCGVQRELGEDKLSDTCATYPRNHVLVDKVHEQSLTLSCPEAARLALLHSDAFDFVESPTTVRPDVVEHMRPKHGLSPEMMRGIRIFALQLIKNESLLLWERLAVLAIYCENLTQIIQTSGHAKIPAMLEEMDAMMSSGGIREALAPLSPDHVTQVEVFSNLWQLKIKRQLTPVQEQVQKAIANGLGADPISHEVSRERLVERYRQGVTQLPLALKEVPFFLEHYLINEMFREMFPFRESSADAHYLRLVTRFGLVRFMLAAQCTDINDLPSPAQMARTVQVFSRLYQHDSNFASLVDTALKNTGWNSLEKIYRFLRT